MAKITIKNETSAPIPRALFRKIADRTLPSDYKLGVVFLDSLEMKRLNLIYRNKNEPTDILSFPYDSSNGEIYISPDEARRVAPNFDRDYDNFIAFLFIHGCVHLKGYDHSAKMENIEAEIRQEFNI